MKLENSRYMDEWIRVPLCGEGDKLYHYTTAEGVRGIVEDRKFMATKSDFLNDKLEFQYALEVMEKLVQTYIVNEAMAERFFAVVKEEIRRLGIISIGEGEEAGGNSMSFYVVAFSKLQNNALLWAEFTEFNGYCLEFNYERLVKGFEERAFLHGTVIYNEKEQTACLLEGLLSCIHGLIRAGHADLADFFEENAEISEKSLRALAEDMAIVCSVYAMFFKKAFFAGEQEYRFVFAPLKEGGAEQQPRFRIFWQMFLPYILVEYGGGGEEALPLESVMLGAKNNSDIATRGMRHFLKVQGLDIPVLLSDIPLRY